MAKSKKPSLQAYRKKRHLDRTPEPTGQRSKTRGRSAFVIQKHDATKLHYDFRLAVGGVLKSWAVPKGPSTDPRKKRLAIQTEDHPLDYADFEGVIPEDEYGGGTVLVWDMGSYRNTTKKEGQKISMDKALEHGHATFELKGKKLKGGYALTRTGKKSQKRWLLVKIKDAHADARRKPTSTQPKSVLSHRTVKQIEKDEAEAAEE